MEQLIQRFIRYFYAVLIGTISIQLVDTVIATIAGNIHCDTFILMFLSAINIILLSGSLIYNIKQRFTESKANAKILRITIALLVLVQAILCYVSHPNIIAFGNHFMTIVLIEIVLTYRIRSIEHLEELANKFKDTLD